MSAKGKYLGVGWKCPKCEKTIVARNDAAMLERGQRHQRNCKGKAETKP